MSRIAGALTMVSFALAAPALRAELRITEFLASPGGGLRDVDGDVEDWIELRNVADAPVDLAGWYLSDDAANPERWRFAPETGHDLGPGEFIVVFASGKDRPLGPEYHTDFRLDASGESLFLAAPDGRAVQSFAPFPRQREGISYGLAMDITELVGPGARADWRPAGPGPLEETWMDPALGLDASWQSATLGVGFQRGESGPPADLVGYWSFDATLADGAGRSDGLFRGGAEPAWVDGHDGAPRSAIRFDGVDDIVEIPHRDASLPISQHEAFSVSLWVRGGPQADRRVFSEGSSTNNTPVFNIGTDQSGASGRVDLFVRTADGSRPLSHVLSDGAPFDDEWHHLAWTDENGDATLWIDGEPDARLFDYDRRVMSLDRTSIGAILRAATSFHFAGDIDEVSFWSRALSGGEVRSLAGGATPLGIGGGSYAGYVRTDVGDAMPDTAGAWIRVPFVALAAVDDLDVSVRYDAGFTLWIDGEPLSRRNVAEVTGWSSLALGEPDEARATTVETLRIARPLAAGAHVLAVHAMKSSLEDEDFLLDIEIRSRSGDEAEERYFLEPTPGEPNAVASPGLVADTTFSVDRGHFDAPFVVEIGCATPGAEIRYTVDGSEPTAIHGDVYDGPLTVAGTTVLRAAAFRADWVPSNVDTQTYLFVADVLVQTRPPEYPASWSGTAGDYDMDQDVVSDPRYRDRIVDALRSLPSVSLVLPVPSLFGVNGIYSNSEQSGSAWERRASFEYLGRDSADTVQADAGLRITGNRSRSPAASPKHGLRCIFRGEYGDAKLRHALFDDTEVSEFDTIIVKPNAFDSWVADTQSLRDGAQYGRDRLLRDLQRNTGHPTSHGRWVHLYLNGLYWGVYDLCERPDAAFAASHWGGQKEAWDAVKNHEELVDGTLEAYRELDRLRSSDLTTAAGWRAYRELVDVENFVDYLIVNMYAPATDWPGNYYMVFDREARSGFKFISWDAEYAFLEGLAVNRTLPHRRDADSPTKFYHAVRENEEFRTIFGDHLQRHFFDGGALTPARVDETWMETVREVELALVAESARWGDARRSRPYVPEEEWLDEQRYLRAEVFPRRGGIVLGQFRAQGMYPGVDAPTFSRHGGAIEPGFELRMSTGVRRTLYTLDGTDPRSEGGIVEPGTLEYREGDAIVLEETTRVAARSLVDGEWSAKVEAVFVVDSSALRVTELMYHPPDAIDGDGAAFEFIELQNTSAKRLVVAGMAFDRGVRFTWPFEGRDRALDAGEVAVIVRDEGAFRARYGEEPRVMGTYDGALDDGGEDLRLVDALGRVVLGMRYDDAWYADTDGHGRSLEARDAAVPRDDWSVADAWRPSADILGSPGRVDGSDPGRMRPGDFNADARLDISDAIALLGWLFAGGAPPPCATHDANARLLDANADATIDLTDAIRVLLHLFQGGPPPAGGTGCAAIAGCPAICE